jgi:hypothetical protein
MKTRHNVRYKIEGITSIQNCAGINSWGLVPAVTLKHTYTTTQNSIAGDSTINPLRCLDAGRKTL